MTESETTRLLLQLVEQQNKILEHLKSQQHTARPNKDVWDRLMPLGPIFSALIIACVGSYFTYTYNQQQLKVQEIQTIEKFIPHLVGDEKSKRAAILAISSLGNNNLAARVASIFASEGTASALQSIAQKTDSKDKQFVQEALYKTLEALADKYREGNNYEEAIETIKKELALKEAAFGKDSPELSESVAKLGSLYELHGEHDLAEMEFGRLNGLKRNASTTAPDQSAAANVDELKNPVQSSDDLDRKPTMADVQKPIPEVKKTTSVDIHKSTDSSAGSKGDELAVADKVKPGKIGTDTRTGTNGNASDSKSGQ